MIHTSNKTCTLGHIYNTDACGECALIGSMRAEIIDLKQQLKDKEKSFVLLASQAIGEYDKKMQALNLIAEVRILVDGNKPAVHFLSEALELLGADVKVTKPIPDYGELMTREQFEKHCNAGGLTNDDGSGYYASETHYYAYMRARPSDFRVGRIKTEYTHVMWFNK